MAMAKPLVSDELWSVCEPVIPRLKKSPKGGRPPVGNREALTGILFVLMTGIPWEDLPLEMGCGCGMTCWRRMVAWQRAGVWDKLHRILLAKLQQADQIDWSRAIVDSASLKAVLGGKKPARIRRIAASVAASTI
jgi:transposase